MHEAKQKYKTVLTIAGFDGGGGAGIQADLKTFAALGCYGLSVLSALPVQNTQGVQSIYKLSRQCVDRQLCAIFQDFEVDAIKIGMLYTKQIVESVAAHLVSYQHLPIVLDPVMRATSGDQLTIGNATASMVSSLFPLVTLLTPNLEETSVFLERSIQTKEEMEEAAFKLRKLGLHAVIIKGGHAKGTLAEDFLSHPQGERWFSSKRIISQNVHGTGCTLSSAITAYLAHGYLLVEAVELAKIFLFQAIEAGAAYKMGYGSGPLHHFFNLWG